MDGATWRPGAGLAYSILTSDTCTLVQGDVWTVLVGAIWEARRWTGRGRKSLSRGLRACRAQWDAPGRSDPPDSPASEVRTDTVTDTAFYHAFPE